MDIPVIVCQHTNNISGKCPNCNANICSRCAGNHALTTCNTRRQTKVNNANRCLGCKSEIPQNEIRIHIAKCIVEQRTWSQFFRMTEFISESESYGRAS